MDPQKVPDHHTDPVTPPVLSHLRPEQALQHRTPPVALQPLSSLLVVVLLEELVGPLASSCLRSPPATVP